MAGDRVQGCVMGVTVWKLGGSILVDMDSYQKCANLIRSRLHSDLHARIVAVVSARQGETDELLALARSVVGGEPEDSTLDLLWSTGEIRSTALLTLYLQAAGVRAVALDVQQTGISYDESLHVDPVLIRCALVSHQVVVVPGFLATGSGAAVVSLGRGGSDLSAVAIAAALRADRCELIKDVAGYFAADPHLTADPEHLAIVDYERALAMAHRGCGLVQAAALEAAQRADLTLIIRAADDSRRTIVARYDASQH